MDEFVCIKYPGYIKNIDKVLESLGGINSIEDYCFDKTEKILLRFENKDPNLISLTSTIELVEGIIIKFKRNKKTGEIKVKIFGKTIKTIEFNKIFDFQLPTILKVKECFKKIYANEKIDIIYPTHFVPRELSIIEEPQEFNLSRRIQYDEVFSNVNSTMNIDIINNYDKCSTITHMYFSNNKLPSFEVDCNKIPQDLNPSYHHLWRPLIDIFKNRKICTKLYIETTLNINRDIATTLIHYIAFYWIDGPWARCWNFYDYDPRINSDSAILQSLDYRKFSKMKDFQITQDIYEIYSPYILSASNIDKSGIYQLIDIIIPTVQSFIEQSLLQKSSECDQIEGWMSKQFYKNLRQLLANTINNAHLN